MKDHSKMAAAFIVIAGCFWGIIGLFSSRLAGSGFSSPEITLIRNTVASAGMLTYLFFFKRDQIRIHLKDFWIFFGTGVVSIVFFNVMYFITIELATLSVAAILLYTAPCFVMIMSVLFFHESFTKKKALALLLAFSGCVFTTGIVDSLFGSGAGVHVTGLGILTGIASGFGYALYSIFGNVALKKYSTETVTTWTFIVAALFLAPFCLRGSFLIKFTGVKEIGNALGIGIIATLCPFIFYTEGLKYTEPGKASIMAFVEPMVACLVSFLILHEPMSLTGIVGIILIFLSVVILNV